MAGSTVVDGPLPALVKNVASLYHSQVAFVPSVPPTTVRVLTTPAQVGSLLTVMLVGSTDAVLTVTSTLIPAVVLQSPSART